jgi:hypothetical protein
MNKYYGYQNKFGDGRTTVVLVEPRNGTMNTEYLRKRIFKLCRHIKQV